MWNKLWLDLSVTLTNMVQEIHFLGHWIHVLVTYRVNNFLSVYTRNAGFESGYCRLLKLQHKNVLLSCILQ